MVGIIHTACMKGASMTTTAEKISIALPPEMVHIVRAAVATGVVIFCGGVAIGMGLH